MNKHNLYHLMLLPLLIAGIALASFVVMLLWNRTLPNILGVDIISYWQAVKLFLLGQALSIGPVTALFALGGVFHNHGMRRNREIHHRWMNMTEKEREEFMARRHPFYGRMSNNKNGE